MTDSQYPPSADSLLAILHRLRAPGGCPWDRGQTRASLKRHLAGEVAELLDAIDREEPEAICEELGDVLMNALFQVAVAEERGEFTLADVWRGIIDKMIRRHEHVFGSARAETAEDVAVIWRRVKARERGREHAPAPDSALDNVPHYLSALDRASALQTAAAKVGFDWPDAEGVVDKIAEECGELRRAFDSGDADAVEDELGDLMFAAVNLARFGGGDAEAVLRRANRKFERRFRRVEEIVGSAGESMASVGLERLNAAWNEAKRAERGAGLQS